MDFFLPVHANGSTSSSGVGTKRKARPAATSAKSTSKRAKKVATPDYDDEDQERYNMHSSDDEAADDDDEGDGFGRERKYSSDEEQIEETADEKRLRLAKEYLARMKKDTDDADEEEVTDRAISSKLMQQAREESGKHLNKIAGKYMNKLPPTPSRSYRGHSLPLTCVALSPDDNTIFTGSKDCCFIQHDVESGKRVVTRGGRAKKGMAEKDGHTGHILSVSVASDGNLVATAGRDKNIRIWDVRTRECVKVFTGHRDIVTGVAFRPDSNQLYSCSHDRTVKIWGTDVMAYVETLYGHTGEINTIDTMSVNERAISAGVDRSCRLWKVVEESQLVFKGHSASIDCIYQLNESIFLTGSQDGGIGLWSTEKKRPYSVFSRAHGKSGMTEVPWVSAITGMRRSDLVASGSSSGFVQLWRCNLEKGLINRALAIPLEGFVNGLAISSSGRFLVAAIGQEHKFGRWARNAAARNGVQLIPLTDLKPAPKSATEEA